MNRTNLDPLILTFREWLVSAGKRPAHMLDSADVSIYLAAWRRGENPAKYRRTVRVF